MENDQKNIGAGGQTELIKRRRSEVPDAERVKTLQDKLYQKAKQEKSYKFYILYDKIFQSYMLREAWQQVRMNQGSAGVDGITISDIEANDIDTYLQELSEELRKRTYKPQAVKRVMIPKANGGERPLGIPTVKDRIVQTVCKMIIEPIFEADFEDSSYGFRPQRSSKDAMKAIKEHLKSGKTEVLDADLSKFFDSIPHEKLMLTLKERIADPRILQLIHSWLKAPVKEKNGMSGGKKNKTGTPQGGVISPLLANVYLHLLDRIINSTRSEFNKLGICIVRYADDFVLMAKSIPETVIDKLRTLLERMGLSLNAEKTKRINAQESTFNFLGFTVRYSNDLYVANKKYWEIMPSKQSEIKVKFSRRLAQNAQKIRRDLFEMKYCLINNFPDTN
jgi:RNA-directed DNA polymerase